MGLRDWFRRRRGGPKMAGVAPFPIELEIYPGRLSMIVHDHVVDRSERGCWTFVSRGLASAGHREVVLTVLREEQEPASEIPFSIVGSYFASLLAFAEHGQLVEEWGTSCFDEPALWGRRGVIYAPVLNLGDVPVPVDALAAIVVEDVEIAYARTFGGSRVLALLGLATHCYPWPPWFDRTRTPLPLRRSVEDGVLSQLPVLCSIGATGSKEGDVITIQLPARVAATLPTLLARLFKPGFVITFAIDPEADACCAFDGTRAGIISPIGSATRRAAVLMLVIVRDATSDSCRLVEDGVGLMLTPEGWAQLEPALTRGQPWSRRFGELELRLRWHTDPSPLRAERWQWGRRSAASPTTVVPPPTAVVLGDVAIDGDGQLPKYAREGIAAQIHGILAEHFERCPPTSSATITVVLRLTRSTVEIDAESDADLDLDGLLVLLRRAPRTMSESGEVVMRLEFEARPLDRPPATV